MFIRGLFVFNKLFILFKIAVWPSLGKSCPLGFPLMLFLLCAVLIVRVPFRAGVEFNCLGS